MKKKPIVFLLALVLTSTLFSQNLYVTGGWIFTGLEDDVIQNPGIIIQRGKIVSIGAELPPENYETLQLTNEDYVLPGLIDLHAHYRVQAEGAVRDDTIAMPKIFLANGVTTTFPAGEIQPHKMRDLRIQIDKGNRTGPRILNSGPYYGSAAPDWNNNFTVEDVHARVDKWAALGAKGFKAKNINPELLQALIERAHQHGLTVTAHLNSGVGNSVNPQDAILMGIDRIEHFLGGDLLSDTTAAYNSLAKMDPADPRLEEIIQLYVNRKVYFDPTINTYGSIAQLKEDAFEFWIDEKEFLTPYYRKVIGNPERGNFGDLSEKLFAVKMKVIKRYYDAGGLITLGTDRPYLQRSFLGFQMGGFSDHREMQLLSEAGIPNPDVIRIATLNSAQAIGLSDKLGTIEVGKWGDLMVIKGNPIQSIKNTRSVHTVIKGGVLYSTKELLDAAKGKLGPVSATDWK
ncbi:MAG: amidohydrolase family protein [Cyclobacteriaceae bacterium]